ncbi:hypothetical protein ACO0RG_003094 [Hanseniaspora osmophila]
MSLPSVSVSKFENLIEQATSETIPNGEIDLIRSLEVSDIIKSKSLPTQQCLKVLIKEVNAANSPPIDLNSQLSIWRLIEICFKNGGESFIKELLSNEFMKILETSIVKAYEKNYETVELFDLLSQVLYDMKNYCEDLNKINYPYNNPAKVWNRLQDYEGITFSYNKLVKNDIKTFDSKQPADWVDADSCMICSANFSMFNRKHHCRSCGGTFCQKHSSNFIPLLDLGILEAVRVCDNCFEDYDLKKNKYSKKADKHHSPKSKTSKHRVKGQKVGHSSKGDSFDEELRRAIELSLQEQSLNVEGNQPAPQEPVAKVRESGSYHRGTNEEQEEEEKEEEEEEEEDEDLKRAIELSLKEAEKSGAKLQDQTASLAQSQSFVNMQTTALNSDQAPPMPSNPNEITTKDEDDIYLFASLVEKLKTQPLHIVLQDSKLSQLYANITHLKRKINLELQETDNKYGTFIQMNSQISDIMNVYDQILESQLNSINLQQNQAIMQPSDPDSYYKQFAQPAQPVPQQQVHETKQTYAEQHNEPPVANQLENLVFPQSELQESEPPMTEESEPPAMTEAKPQVKSTPYPTDHFSDKVSEEKITESAPYPITQVNFPTVPASKPLDAELKNQESQETAKVAEEEHHEEPMLIEL